MTIKERLEEAHVQAIKEHLRPTLQEIAATGVDVPTIHRALIELCFSGTAPGIVEAIFRSVLASQETE